jgi:hypothetical protein
MKLICLLIVLSVFVAGCGGALNDNQPEYLRVLGVPDGAPGMEAAARITQRYLEERRYLRVAFPGLTEPTEEQERNALALAVPQPAFRESNPMGPGYIGCWIHEPIPEVARTMARRCEAELREVAESLGLSLANESGW